MFIYSDSPKRFSTSRSIILQTNYRDALIFMSQRPTEKIVTIQDLYSVMDFSAHIRREALSRIKKNREVIKAGEILDSIIALIESSTREGDQFLFDSGNGTTCYIDLTTELMELRRDVTFFKMGLPGLLEDIREHSSVDDRALQDLLQFKPDLFVTDRDGTISHYSNLYGISHQAAYNAKILIDFASHFTTAPVILTSGPMEGPGIRDLSVFPDNEYMLASSKGREYLDGKGNITETPLTSVQKRALDTLNEKIEILLQHPDTAYFRFIGSGFQKKYGQTTIARQDKARSIPEDASLKWKEKIEQLVNEVDRENALFRIEDTGKDIEVHLVKDPMNPGASEFTKGDGLEFILKTGDIHPSGRILIAGDTPSDLPMVDASLRIGLEPLLFLIDYTGVSIPSQKEMGCPVYNLTSVDSFLLLLESYSCKI